MSSLSNIKELFTSIFSGVKEAITEFVSNQKATDKENIEKMKSWFQSNNEKIGDVYNKVVDNASKNVDLNAYFDDDGNLNIPLEFENTKEGKKEAKKYSLLLNNFYKPTINEDGNIVYELNEYGRILAGEDGVLTKSDIEAMDKHLLDGVVSQIDINKFKKAHEEEAQELRQPTDLNAFLDEDGKLPESLSYDTSTQEGKNQMAHDKLLLETFYKYKASGTKTTVEDFVLNTYGEWLAGEDGVIDKSDIEALDTDGDGKITKDEIDAWKEKADKEMEDNYNTSTITALLKDNDNKLPETLTYDPAKDETKFDRDQFLRDNFYKKGESKGDKVVYELNDYGKELIKEEDVIKALDANNDGRVSQEEIDAYKAKIDETNTENKQPTTLTAFLDEKGEIKSPVSYDNTEEGKAQMEHDKLLLETLYGEAKLVDGKYVYEFNNTAKSIAGEDGIISKEELMKLDTNKDEKVSKEEAEAFKKELDEVEAEAKQPKDLLSFIDESGNLPESMSYNADDKETIEHDKNLIDLLYEIDTDSKWGKDVNKYKLSSIALEILDTDGNGKISKAELAVYDKDGNGKLSAEEFDTLKSAIDKAKESANPTSLSTYVEKYGKLTSPLTYNLNNEEDKAKMEYDKLLLDTLYTKTTTVNGTVIYTFNSNGLILAGGDFVITNITEDELSKLDFNNDGKITQEEVDQFDSMKTWEKLKLVLESKEEEDDEEDE